MPAKDLGLKHTCWKCSAKFYDLKKPTAICPKCGSDARAAPVVKTSAAEKRSRAAAAKADAVEDVPEVPEEDAEGDLEEADAEEAEADEDAE